MKIASTIKTKLEENFRDHLSQDSLTARQLVQIMAINIFALSSIKQLDENGVLASKRPEDGLTEQDHFTDTADEEQCWKLTLDLMRESPTVDMQLFARQIILHIKCLFFIYIFF